MEIRLKYLTNDDQRLLMERARRITFARDDRVMEEGWSQCGIWVVCSGTLRVERTNAGKTTVLDHLEAGDVFGEMSFLDGAGASASIVADEQSEVDVIDGDYVSALLHSVPGMASRFYQSLAVLLSQRLWAAQAR